MDNSCQNIEDLDVFIKARYIKPQISIVFSNISLRKKGGVLKNIEYFQEHPVDVIIDLQRNKDELNALGDYLKIPILSMVPQWQPQGKYIISMYPSIETINWAIVDVLLRYEITESILLFDAKRSRQAMNLHTASQREYIKIEMMPELDMDNEPVIKDAIRQAWNTQIKTVVLLCDTHDIKKVMNATLQTRLYDKDSEDWKWIASDIDFRRPDYEPLEGIVAFRLSLPEWQKSFRQERQRICAKELYTEVFYASIKDALYLINAAMQVQHRNMTFMEKMKKSILRPCQKNRVSKITA
ncbi:uncharacterized protein LOC124452286 [Xenia sp. Carnegie-2017]|uniref:uncharacterized protein LOC124452286 n=1 Tax=Xenia sp. Carnegie-2017 TaxID=2897299 RepID=UPI001F04ABFD|nr:uncharacterized protein LOC124452286 [Xenia sp. Carnegie-2017]